MLIWSSFQASRVNNNYLNKFRENMPTEKSNPQAILRKTTSQRPQPSSWYKVWDSELLTMLVYKIRHFQRNTIDCLIVQARWNRFRFQVLQSKVGKANVTSRPHLPGKVGNGPLQCPSDLLQQPAPCQAAWNGVKHRDCNLLVAQFLFLWHAVS